jgi:hypothetical protein
MALEAALEAALVYTCTLAGGVGGAVNEAWVLEVAGALSLSPDRSKTPKPD